MIFCAAQLHLQSSSILAYLNLVFDSCWKEEILGKNSSKNASSSFSLNNQRKIAYSNSCILFSLLVSMSSIFSNFLKHTSKIICFPFSLSTIAFQVGAPSFCSSLPSNCPPPQGALPYPCQVYPTWWCAYTDDGNDKLTQNAHDKSSTCFTNALQHLYPVTWMQLKTWCTVEAPLGMPVGFSKFLNGYLGSMHKEFTQNLCMRLN